MLRLPLALHGGADAGRAETTADAVRELGIEPGQLGDGDWLLGWQGRRGSWRYCHSFSDEDVEGLVAGVSDLARLRDDFCSDGRSGELNRYLVLERL